MVRLATGGTEKLGEGALHPDLVNRLSAEASKSAEHILTMCIRALDYLPPVDVTFGDYLRALITSDADLVPDDTSGYRVAFIEAFRRHGIYPENVRSLSESSLLWNNPAFDQGDLPFVRQLKDLVQGWDLMKNREDLYNEMKKVRKKTHEIFKDSEFKQESLSGLKIIGKKFEVHSLRPVHRVGPGGQLLVDLLVEITQRRPGYKKGHLKDWDESKKNANVDFWFRGGCTVLIDMKTTKLRYCISKDINDESRYLRQQAFTNELNDMSSFRSTYFNNYDQETSDNRFSCLHKSYKKMEEF